MKKSVTLHREKKKELKNVILKRVNQIQKKNLYS